MVSTSQQAKETTMNNNFIEALTTNFTTTDNGAIALKSSLSNCCDFFAQGGALRGSSQERIWNLFFKAFCEDREIAVRLMFMFRDIRGGQGQRQVFRDQFSLLAATYPKETSKLLSLIPEYGRWDDVYCALNTLRTPVLETIEAQLKEDLLNIQDGKSISLLGKWLKRINTSSATSRKIGHITKRHLKLSNKQYRKLCSKLNRYLGVTENLMSSKEWDKIEYSKVPGQCLFRNRATFNKRDNERYMEWVEMAQAGKVKVNAATIYPHQIVHKIRENQVGDYPDFERTITPEEAQMLWINMVDFAVDSNAIVVADLSGSMDCLRNGVSPIDVSIALALYFSERAKGPYKDTFITFSREPTLQRIVGDNIWDRVSSIDNGLIENTDLEKVFGLILQTAIYNNLAAEDIVDKIYIISDMQFDEASNIGEDKVETLYQTIKGKFDQTIYTIPKLVYWNVNAGEANTLPVLKNTPNTCMISGFSPSILQFLGQPELPSTEDLMLMVVNSPRYSNIKFE